MTDPYAAFSSLAIDRVGDGVVRITLDGPDRNALSPEAHRELVDVWGAIARDDQARVVLVRGAGNGSFSSGGSAGLGLSVAEDWDVRTNLLEEARLLVRNVLDCPVPIVSAINGSAYGAGLVPALLADISITGRTARLIDGHVGIGVAAGDHSVLCWPLLCGMAKAKYYLLTNEPLTGEEAERIGLVSLCVDDDVVQQRAMNVAERIARGSRTAQRWTKHALNHWYRQAMPLFEVALGLEIVGFSGPDVIEGIHAAREKRPPRF